MAVVAGIQAGKVPFQIQGATGVAPIRFGASAALLAASLTGAVNVALPVDPQGNAYAAYQVTSASPIWFCWTTGTGAATVGGANCYLITAGSQETIVAPPGATSVAAIYDTGTTTGSFCIVGLF